MIKECASKYSIMLRTVELKYRSVPYFTHSKMLWKYSCIHSAVNITPELSILGDGHEII